MKNKATKLAISIALPQLAGFIGSAFTFKSLDVWYESLIKPSFNPPSWVFGPVWFILYLLMGVALYLVWTRNLNDRRVRFVFWFFIAHLGLNALWSVLFFGFQDVLLALIEIVILWITLVFIIIKFWRISRAAAYLLLPYLVWGTFATVLNFVIWRLN